MRKKEISGRAPRVKARAQRIVWRRTEQDQSMSQALGENVRTAREARGLSLAELSSRSGIPGATLSRIENNKMSPTFAVLAKVMDGLEMDWGDLLGSHEPAPGEKLVSFAKPGAGRSTKVRHSTARVLHSHDNARSLPLFVHIDSANLDEVGGLVGHRGEEFCYVLSGTLILHIEGRAPRTLKAGASALFDSSIPHAYLTEGAAGADLLLVVARGTGQSPGEPLG
jgi:transcriptional regulator with XRE-family HTH domain